MQYMKKRVTYLGVGLILAFLTYQLVEACGSPRNDYAYEYTGSGPNVVVWLDKTTNAGLLNAAIMDPSGILNTATILSSSGQVCNSPKIAYTDTGDAVVIWLAANDVKITDSLYASFLPNNGEWSSEICISGDDEVVIPDTINFTIDDLGNISLIWESLSFIPNPNDPTQPTREINLRRAFGTISSGWSPPYTLARVK